MSENILADYLLDGVGLSREEEPMIRTACGNRHKFAEIATALRQQHPKVQEPGRRSSRPDGGNFAWHRDSGGGR